MNHVKWVLRSVLAAGAMAALLAGNHAMVFAADAAEPSGKIEARERETTVNATVVVLAIDQEARKLTVEGPEGNQVTLVAGDEVKRLNEIQKGDQIKVRYTTSFLVERREATEAEKQEPLAVVGVLGRAPASDTPAGGGARIIKAVTKVVTLDQVNNTITVQGPLGGLLTAPVKDPGVLKTLKIGDTLVLTYTEAVALSLEKVVQK